MQQLFERKGQKRIFRSLYPLLLCNLLEHFDTALYGFLSSKIAPLLFPKHDPFTALIYTFALIPLSYIFKPLGTFVIGYACEKLGKEKALGLFIYGISGSCFFLAFTPFHLGFIAPIYLTIFRIILSFFAAGYVAIAPMLFLEKTPSIFRDFYSSLFSFTTMGGIILASGLCYWITPCLDITKTWKQLYLSASLLTVLLSIYFLSFSAKTEKNTLTFACYCQNFVSKMKTAWPLFFKIVIISGFDGANYYVAFFLIPAILSLIHSPFIPYLSLMNTTLLCIDAFILPAFGALAEKIGGEKLMRYASFCIACCGSLLFFFLDSASFAIVLLVRLLVVSLGLSFCAPLHAFVFRHTEDKTRYSFLSLAYCIGMQIFGASSVAISLWIYKKSGLAFSAGVYWSCLAGLTGFVMAKKNLLPTLVNFSTIRHFTKKD